MVTALLFLHFILLSYVTLEPQCYDLIYKPEMFSPKQDSSPFLTLQANLCSSLSPRWRDIRIPHPSCHTSQNITNRSHNDDPIPPGSSPPDPQLHSELIHLRTPIAFTEPRRHIGCNRAPKSSWLWPCGRSYPQQDTPHRSNLFFEDSINLQAQICALPCDGQPLSRFHQNPAETAVHFLEQNRDR